MTRQSKKRLRLKLYKQSKPQRYIWRQRLRVTREDVTTPFSESQLVCARG